MEVPVYTEEGKSFHADSCGPLVQAAHSGELELVALSRGTYPGEPMPDRILPGLRSVGYWDATRKQDWGLPWHRNEGIEVSWLETGSVSFLLGPNVYTLKPGQMTITRPWQPHKLGNPNVGAGRLHWLILDVGVRQPHQKWMWPPWLILSEKDIAALTNFLRGNEQPVWEPDAEIGRCFKQIASTLQSESPGESESRLSIHINELFLQLLTLFRKEKVRLSPELSTARRSTELFLEALKSNPGEPWTLEIMAECCRLGVTRFVHYCREVTNCTPMQYLNRIRVEQAAERLLSERDASITEVALACGFSSSQYFATVFKQHYKCTPRAYRMKARP